MPTEQIEIRVNTDAETNFRRVAAALRGTNLEAKLRRNLRNAAQPVIADLRAEVMSVDVQSSRGGAARPSYSRGLRASIARQVRVSVAFRGVRFTVQSEGLGAQWGPYGPALVKYLDGELPGYRNWRHPVFGQEDVWEVQYGRPWFFETIRRHAANFELACAEAMVEVIQEAARGI